MKKIFYPQPEGEKKIEGKSKSQCHKGQINKAGAYHPGTYPKPFSNSATYLKSSFLEIVQYLIE
jgi:hypothetical protein